MGWDRTDDGVVAVDGRGHAAPCQARADALSLVIGHFRPDGIANVTGQEVMLVVKACSRNWRDRRYQARGVGRRAVCDTGDVGYLDDVGRTGHDRRSHRANARSWHVIRSVEVVSFLEALGACFLDGQGFLSFVVEPEGDENDGNKDHTANDTTGNGTRVGASIAAVLLFLLGPVNAYRFGALVAGLAYQHAAFILWTDGTVGGCCGAADDAATEDVVEVPGRDCGGGVSTQHNSDS